MAPRNEAFAEWPLSAGAASFANELRRNPAWSDQVPWCAGEGKLVWLPKSDSMRVPNRVLNAVVFLGGRTTPGDPVTEHYIGTGFIVLWQHGTVAFPYLVTADHNARILERIDEPIARLNDAQGRGHHYFLPRPTQTELNGETHHSTVWYRHPTDSSADIAVANLLPTWASTWGPNSTISHVPISMFVGDNILHPAHGVIGIGDEVFIPGLLAHAAGKEANSPILRIGNIAMLPSERIRTGLPYGLMEAFLVEVKSLGGISGAPIFVRGTGRVPNKGDRGYLPEPQIVGQTEEYLLLGLAHGHWDIPEDDVNSPEPWLGHGPINMGIAIATPAKKIIETLNNQELIAQRDDLVKELERGRTTMDSTFTRESFMRDLKKVADTKPPSGASTKPRGQSSSKKH